jgi:hypothetical protein
MTTLTVGDLSEELDRESMTAVAGGFWELFGLAFKSLREDQIGEECNGFVCVPYQQED